MKRVGGLFEKIVDFENLRLAAHTAALGKRSRPDVASFLLDLEPELLRLRRQLADGSYRTGPYRVFKVQDPKPRLISAAPFRDRVVHHALTRVIEPIFERRFTLDSFACRQGFGTHRALLRARSACRRFRYVLKCDIRKYFASIDHGILKGLLRRVIKCDGTLTLAGHIIDGAPPQEPTEAYFAGDTLFTPFERARGLPLGNQTSQFFANVYLNPLDQMVRRQLHAGEYLRYVDDFLIFGDDKRRLAEIKTEIAAHLSTLRLRLHVRKSRIYATKEGVGFLGFRLFPRRVRLARDNVTRARRRFVRLQRLYARGLVDGTTVDTSVRAWVAHAEHGDTWRLREQMFSAIVFSRRAP